jgi:hypothetical protein
MAHGRWIIGCNPTGAGMGLATVEARTRPYAAHKILLN